MKRNTMIALALMLALAAGLVAMTLRSLELKRRLRAADDDRVRACDQAKFVATGAVHRAVLSAKMAKERGMEAGLADGSASALGVYVWACADSGDVATKNMAKVLTDLVMMLLQAGELDALSALEAKLDETPLEEWKTIALPAQPSLWKVISGGDEEEAAELERKQNEAAEALDTP